MAGKTKTRMELEIRMADQRAQAEFKRRLDELKLDLAEQTDEALHRTATEKRVDLMVELMCNGLWVTGSTHRQLSRDWGISPSRVMQLAGEAGRVMARYAREGKEEREAIRARIVTSIERIARKAEARGSYAGYRDALEAQTRLAQMHGFLKPVSDQPTSGDSEFADWSDAEKVSYAETGELPARLRGNGHDTDAAATH